MNRVMPNGTEVLIFKNTTNDIQKDEMNFIKGMIIGSYEEKEDITEDMSIYHLVYTVFGEDAEEYKATHGYAHKGDFFIRTFDEHIEHLTNALYNNAYKIAELKKMNNSIKETIMHLNNYQKNSKKR